MRFLQSIVLACFCFKLIHCDNSVVLTFSIFADLASSGFVSQVVRISYVSVFKFDFQTFCLKLGNFCHKVVNYKFLLSFKAIHSFFELRKLRFFKKQVNFFCFFAFIDSFTTACWLYLKNFRSKTRCHKVSLE